MSFENYIVPWSRYNSLNGDGLISNKDTPSRTGHKTNFRVVFFPCFKTSLICKTMNLQENLIPIKVEHDTRFETEN